MPSMEELQLYVQTTRRAHIKVPKNLAVKMGVRSGTIYPITIKKFEHSTSRGVPGLVHFTFKHPKANERREAAVRPQSIIVDAK